MSTDRGLCGGLNTNVFKNALWRCANGRRKGASDQPVPDRHQGRSASSAAWGCRCSRSATGIGDQPHVKDLIGTVKVMLDAYREGKIDRLFIVNARFVNTMTQKPAVQQLLPVETVDAAELQEHWDYIYEPSAAEILDGLLMRYIESQVYRGAVENVRLRNGGAHGGDEERVRQRRQADRRPAARLQQGAAGGDHQGTGGNRRRRGRGLNSLICSGRAEADA